MFVRSLLLRRYGAFADRLIDFGPGSLSLVIGANEAGKSTALEALSDLLWGIPTHSGQAFLHGRPALALEAGLDLAGGERVDVLRRSTGLTRVDTGADVLPVWQSPADSRARWRESFGLSHTELRRGGRLLCEGGGDLAELVFTARSGRSVRDLLAQVQAIADSLYREHRGNKGVGVRQALAEYNEARARVADATAAAAQVQGAREVVEHAAGDVGRAERRVQQARAGLVAAMQRQHAAPDVGRLAEVRARAEDIRSAGALLDGEQLGAHDHLREQLAAAEESVAELGEDLARLTAQRAAIVVEDSVLADAELIRGLHLEAEARFADGQRASSLAREAAGLDEQIAALLADLLGDLGDDSLPELLAALHVPVDRVAQLDALAAELQSFEQRLAAKEEALQAASRRLDEADVRTSNLDLDAVTAVREAVDAIATAGSAVQVQRVAVEARAEAERRRAAALRLAGLPAGAALPATVPSAGAVRGAAEEMATAATAAAEAERQVQRVQAALKQTRQQLEAAAWTEVPPPDALAAARERRDGAVAKLLAAWRDGLPAGAGDLAARVVRSVSDADAVADLLLTHADAAARQTELVKALAEQEDSKATAVDELTTCAARRAEAEAHWAALWPGLGDAVPTPADAAEVRRQVDEARAADEQMAAAASRIAGLQHQVDAQVSSLTGVLARAGRPRPDADLDNLLVAARGLLAEADAAQGRRTEVAQLTRLEREQRRERDDVATVYGAALGRWRVQLRAVGVPEDVDVAAWYRRRDLVAEAWKLQQDADGLRRQVVDAVQRNQRFLNAVTTLAGRHGEPSADPAAAIGLLSQRREAALSARSEAAELEGRTVGVQAQLDEAHAGRTEAQQGLDELRTSVAVATLDELDRAADRSRAAVELAGEAERLCELVRAAAPGLDLEALVEEHAGTEPEVLADASAAAQEELGHAEEELREVLDQQGKARQRERDLTTGAGAAELHAKAQEHLAVVGERVEGYLVARIQAEVLGGELEAYERKHASPLLDEAGEFLQRLTGGRYVALGVSNRDGSRALSVIDADEERHAASELSEGTADQVFLALRLAGIASLQNERQAKAVPTLPVVFDDILMTFDDDRAAAALRVMGELSHRWQIIVFSHHAHLAELAESLSLAALTVAQLAPPQLMEARRTADEIRVRARTTQTAISLVPSPRQAQPATNRNASVSPSGTASSSPSVIREWARAAGYELGERGRIPGDVVAAYEQAHR